MADNSIETVPEKLSAERIMRTQKPARRDSYRPNLGYFEHENKWDTMTPSIKKKSVFPN